MNERCEDCERNGYVYCFQYPHTVPKITMRERMVKRIVTARVFTGGGD